MEIATDETLVHIKFLARTFGRDGIRYVIVVFLLELGVPTNYDGFDFLVNAIAIYYEDPDQMITEGLYPAVASLYNRKKIWGTQVESSIRNAIRAAWRRRDAGVWIRYFSPDASGDVAKPSNTEFISTLARMLQVWEGCCIQYEKQKHEGMVLV